MSKQRKVSDFFAAEPAHNHTDSVNVAITNNEDDGSAESDESAELEVVNVQIPEENPPSPKRSKSDTVVSTKGRKFCHAWTKEFPWLEYKKSDDVMVCKLCRELHKTGPWGTTGTRNFR